MRERECWGELETKLKDSMIKIVNGPKGRLQLTLDHKVDIGKQ